MTDLRNDDLQNHGMISIVVMDRARPLTPRRGSKDRSSKKSHAPKQIAGEDLATPHRIGQIPLPETSDESSTIPGVDNLRFQVVKGE